MTFSMTVADVFNFTDGRTILTGPVEGRAKLIPRGRYGLFREGALLREVELEGEMMPRVTAGARVGRAVSTRDALGLASGPPALALVLAPLDDTPE